MQGREILFIVLSLVACFAGLGVVLAKHPIKSALSLVVNMFSIAFLYFTLEANMLGITQIMVYVGAIMVLFLFVVMLLNIGSDRSGMKILDLKLVPAILIALLMFSLISFQVLYPLFGMQYPVADEGFGSPEAIGKSLFSQYVLPFEVASVLLLVGIVGAILLARRKA